MPCQTQKNNPQIVNKCDLLERDHRSGVINWKQTPIKISQKHPRRHKIKAFFA